MTSGSGRHIQHGYDDELEHLRSTFMEMGGLVEHQLGDGLHALVTRDARLGDEVCTADYRINELEVRIDEEATAIIARRQPAASDLRLLTAVIRCGTDLERIGDEAEKLGRFAIEFAGGQAPETGMLSGLDRLGGIVRAVLHEALDAFARGDADVAARIAADDGRINAACDAAMRELITYMMEDPRTMQRSLHALWCTRALERIGDHARNLCEAVIYVVEGRDIRHEGDQPAQ